MIDTRCQYLDIAADEAYAEMMAGFDVNPILSRLAAVFLIAAVAVLPLMHTGSAAAASQADSAADMCEVDLCGCCPGQALDAGSACCGDSDQPESPAPCDGPPCDCPCCGKVLPAVSMISPLPALGLFWDPSPTPSWTPHIACPKSAAVCVDIQPPIV
ncbi:hypothetical protein OT109_19080 [Phycisphaeraceae bacterium D3-23]